MQLNKKWKKLFHRAALPCAALSVGVVRFKTVFWDNSQMGCNQQTGYIQSYRTTIVLLHSTFLGGRSKKTEVCKYIKARTLESPSRKLLHDEVHSFMPQLLKWGWVKTQNLLIKSYIEGHLFWFENQGTTRGFDRQIGCISGCFFRRQPRSVAVCLP